MSYNGYVSPARLAMAEHLGRCLGSDEWVYFKDGDSFNICEDNLLLVPHKELNKLNEIRRIVKQLDKLSAYLVVLRAQLAEIRFNDTPCDCHQCTRSIEARQAEYKL